jgi:hypothetical protein
MRLATDVIVSTPALRDSLCPSAEIIPNAFNHYALGFNSSPREKVIVWRGGFTYYRDLETVAGQIKGVAEAFPEWNWHFIGDVSPSIPESIPAERFRLHPYCDLFDYFALLYSLRPSVHIKPLCDTKFNQSKSNAAWMEAAGAGAVTVAPNWPEWTQPGAVNYSQGDFGACLAAILSAEADERARNLELSRQKIKADFLLGNINQRRLDLLNEITKAK